MWWLIAGLSVLGAVCGAAVQPILFIGVLIAVAMMSLAATAAAGAGAMALIFILTIATLLIAYVAGLVLRTLIRSRYPGFAAAIHREVTLPAALGGERR
jgi:hypothetical protein